ncbi:hypothetical protein FLAG1_05826 [Fusarium langsethiae]|uniref:Uncharacterized protein n=1 Tax=Fusarium langsethiae TaxID=179993 RepID=A0A0N1J2S4_FUSLA|nr:hypothetical protein FLAG1_05826 [Fusarium langsethiae]GKU03317.1 unnamed protein product [Fusarium langsethiae]GKU18781.1 unnamed protein product [Fusarium langsethiae]
MPDFRRLFTIAKVLTCSCFSIRKPTKAMPYQVDNIRAPPGEEERDWSVQDQYYGISQSPFDVLTHPDKFEIIDEQDGFAAAGTAVKKD